MRLYCDIECYPNYYLIMFINESGRYAAFEQSPYHEIDLGKLLNLITARGAEIVTFNGTNYDLPMMSMGISGYSNSELKDLSDAIVTENLRSWNLYNEYGVPELDINHIDLYEVAPGVQISLKTYGGRLHSKRMQDLPYPADMELTREQMREVKLYCRNDLTTTMELAEAIAKPLELRDKLSKEIGRDVRSKSDAQIAEAVLRKEYIDRTGEKPEKVAFTPTFVMYDPPKIVKFRTPELKAALNLWSTTPMEIKETTGHIQTPDTLKNFHVSIGETTYKIGIGGLHSTESGVTHRTDEDCFLVDKDVTSYYPNLILSMGMTPPAFGDVFAPAYQSILDRRVAAKRRTQEIDKEIKELEDELRNLPPEG